MIAGKNSLLRPSFVEGGVGWHWGKVTLTFPSDFPCFFVEKTMCSKNTIEGERPSQGFVWTFVCVYFFGVDSLNVSFLLVPSFAVEYHWIFICWTFWNEQVFIITAWVSTRVAFWLCLGLGAGKVSAKGAEPFNSEEAKPWSWTCRMVKTVWRMLSQMLNGFGLHIPTLTYNTLGCKCNKRRFTECLGMWSTHSRILRSGQCRKHCPSDKGAQSSEAYKAWDFELISYDAFPPYRVDEPGVHNWSWDARHFLRVGCFTHHQPTGGSWSTTFCNFSKAKQKSKGSKPLDRRVIIEEWSLDFLGWISRYPQLSGGLSSWSFSAQIMGKRWTPFCLIFIKWVEIAVSAPMKDMKVLPIAGRIL